MRLKERHLIIAMVCMGIVFAGVFDTFGLMLAVEHACR